MFSGSKFFWTFFIGIVLITHAHAATITVVNTNDSGAGSLRNAIAQANNNLDLDTIEFNIPSNDPNCTAVAGHGPACSIGLGTQVDVVFPVIINGYSQPGSSVNTNPITMGSNAVLLIEIASSTPGNPTNGLVFGGSGAGSTVRGLVLNRFSVAISLVSSSNNVVEGNFIGTDPTGLNSLPNITAGVRVISGANNNTIGGTTPAARNVISGNSIGVQIAVNCSDNTVRGNFIGTNAAGSAVLGSAVGTKGISIENNSPNTTIGGDTVTARNVIVPGAQGAAIDISNTHAGVSIRGNFIGTDVTGTTRLENSTLGVTMLVTTGVTIGGSAATPGVPPGNLIVSGNFGIGGQIVNGLTVKGNLLGTDINGTVLPYVTPPVVGTTYGISLHDANGALIGGTALGDGNVIAGHTDAGIKSTFGSPIGIAILGNSIYSNGISGTNGLGVDLSFTGITPNDDCDSNHPQNFPVITASTFTTGIVTLSGTLNSAPNTTFRLEFFSNPALEGSNHGEGRTFLGSTEVTTNAQCNASFGPLTFARFNKDHVVSSTATRLDAGGSPIQTSEFSQNVFLISISGRVMTPGGRGIPGIRVILTDSNGVVRSAMTSSFGYYRIFEVPLGQTYTLTPIAKSYSFEPRMVTVSDTITDEDFNALP